MMPSFFRTVVANAENAPPDALSFLITSFLFCTANAMIFLSPVGTFLFIGHTFSHAPQSIHKLISTDGYKYPSASGHIVMQCLGQIA